MTHLLKGVGIGGIAPPSSFPFTISQSRSSMTTSPFFSSAIAFMRKGLNGCLSPISHLYIFEIKTCLIVSKNTLNHDITWFVKYYVHCWSVNLPTLCKLQLRRLQQQSRSKVDSFFCTSPSPFFNSAHLTHSHCKGLRINCVYISQANSTQLGADMARLEAKQHTSNFSLLDRIASRFLKITSSI